MSVTKIEWVRNPDGTPGHTVNPIRFRNLETGKVGHYCEKLSAGCKNCYASAMQKPYLSGLEFTAENRDKGELFFDEAVLESVVRRRKPTSYFWADCTDLFGSWVPDEWIDRCFAIAALTPQHRHMFLTKRAERMREYFDDKNEWFFRVIRLAPPGGRKMVIPLANVRLGVSVEDRSQLHRIDYLRETPAALRFLSLEPLLEDLGELDLRGIGWVIVGGESGPGARPMVPDWARSVRDQCQAAWVPFFFKQWGEWGPFGQASVGHHNALVKCGKRAAGRLLDGREWSQLPEVKP